MQQTLLIFSFLFILVFSSHVSAQSNFEDVVYLKNGSVIRGMIIEQVPNESIKIQTRDKNVFVYKMDEVLKITKEEIQPSVPPAAVNKKPEPMEPVKREKKTSGYTNITEWNFLRSFRETESVYDQNMYPLTYESHFDRINNGPSFGIQTVNGYLFNPNFSMGLGVGMQAYDELFLIPFFIDARAYFMETKVTPFTSAEFGYSFTRHQVFGFNTEYEDEGGLMASFEGGIKYQVVPRMALNFSLGYRYQEVSVQSDDQFVSYYPLYSDRSLNQFVVRMGFTF